VKDEKNICSFPNILRKKYFFLSTFLVGAHSSSSKNPLLPQQQQRAPGETR
jgi:hypothetical protein